LFLISECNSLRRNGQLAAFDAACPHYGVNLADGAAEAVRIVVDSYDERNRVDSPATPEKVDAQ
jgi:nitrite reductase/ring-hydroxylating ferredoxin subunit